MRALLDVNVVIALLDASHAFHQRAHVWWAANASKGWASCPLVENGVVRIMSNPAYSSARVFAVDRIVQSLGEFANGTNHAFWADSISLRDANLFVPGRIYGGRQLTDLYLLALAAANKGRLATFDQGIVMSAVKQATAKNLCVI